VGSILGRGRSGPAAAALAVRYRAVRKGFTAAGLAIALPVLAGSPAGAWSETTVVALADQAGRYAPPDLRRQIERHPAALRRGALAARGDRGAGAATDRAAEASARAIAALERHEPFESVLELAGGAAYWIARANDPLAPEDGRREPAYAEDFRRYVDSARPRFAVAFYGEGRDVTSPPALERLAAAARARGAAYGPLIAREYERIGTGSGVVLFDDRSTAFGVAALAYSHAVSDAIATLRYIWLAAGGADRRQLPHLTPP
jgi:hypothetical protein